MERFETQVPIPGTGGLWSVSIGLLICPVAILALITLIVVLSGQRKRRDD